MSKPEIQPSIAHIRRHLQILRSLFRSHPTPHPFPLSVFPDIIYFRSRIQHHEVQNRNGYEHAVSPFITRSIVRTVDISVDDSTSLNEHVVERGIDCTRGDCAGVAGAPPNLDRMYVRIGKQSRSQALWGNLKSESHKPYPVTYTTES